MYQTENLGGGETKCQKPNITNVKQTPTLKLEAPNSFLLRFLHFEFVCCLTFAISSLLNENDLPPEILLDSSFSKEEGIRIAEPSGPRLF